MRALILSGGGARGAYEAGVAVSLLEHEDFELVCGASIGAINGALIAQGDRGELERVWRSMASLGVIRLAPEIEAVAELVADLQRLNGDDIPARATALLKLYQLGLSGRGSFGIGLQRRELLRRDPVERVTVAEVERDSIEHDIHNAEGVREYSPRDRRRRALQ